MPSRQGRKRLWRRPQNWVGRGWPSMYEWDVTKAVGRLRLSWRSERLIVGVGVLQAASVAAHRQRYRVDLASAAIRAAQV